MGATYQVFMTRSATDTNAPPISGAAVTGTGTYYSEQWHQGESGSAVTVEFTGTPTGVLTIWGTNKQDPNLATDADWFDAGAIADPAGAPFTVTFNYELSCRSLRLKYVNATGAGTLKAFATVRGPS